MQNSKVTLYTRQGLGKTSLLGSHPREMKAIHRICTWRFIATFSPHFFQSLNYIKSSSTWMVDHEEDLIHSMLRAGDGVRNTVLHWSSQWICKGQTCSWQWEGLGRKAAASWSCFVMPELFCILTAAIVTEVDTRLETWSSDEYDANKTDIINTVRGIHRALLRVPAGLPPLPDPLHLKPLTQNCSLWYRLALSSAPRLFWKQYEITPARAS